MCRKGDSIIQWSLVLLCFVVKIVLEKTVSTCKKSGINEKNACSDSLFLYCGVTHNATIVFLLHYEWK